MPDRSAWDWIDPLGIRGTRWDPTVIMRDLAKGTADTLPMVDVFGRLLRRLEGRRIEIEREPAVTLVVGEITDAVPANEVVMSARGTAVPIWRRVSLGVHSIDVGGLGAERADVTAVDVRFVDTGTQHLRVASLSARVLLTDVQFGELVADFDLPAEVEVSGTRLVVRPRWSGGRVAVDVTPSVRDGALHLRPESVRVLRWTVPAPSRLPMTLEFPLRNMPREVSVTDVATTDDGQVEATVGMAAVELPVDLRQVVSDLGAESARVAVKLLSGEIWRG